MIHVSAVIVSIAKSHEKTNAFSDPSPNLDAAFVTVDQVFVVFV
jgi:hypothetical protein